VTQFKDNNCLIEIGVFLRPYLFEMLSRLQPYFDLCIYTASEKVYANAILDKFDPENLYFSRRLYRNLCTKTTVGDRTVYIKDLRCIEGYHIKDITIVDNSLLSFAL
jgi:TFIIF-interacting CTD phosphatase-like protein